MAWTLEMVGIYNGLASPDPRGGCGPWLCSNTPPSGRRLNFQGPSDPPTGKEEVISEPSSFAELVRKIRSGDQDAATELVRRYEPAIRRAVRFRLADFRLGAILDSMDICQSVLASFFVRAASGQYELEKPEQLQKLLVAMARNKLRFQARKEWAQRRDIRKQVGLEPNQGMAAPGDTPSRQVADQELLAEVHKRLSAQERQLVEWRKDGLEWEEIADRLSGSPEALRKKLARALDRVAQELGLDEAGHD